MAARVPMLERFLVGIEETIELVGADTRGAHGLHETREFFAFMQQEMDAMMQRWRVHREQIALAEK